MTFYVTSSEVEKPATVNALAGQSQFRLYRNFFKSVFDALIVLAAAPIVLPFVLIMAFLVALDGHNPFYSQVRIGRGGRHFRIWKIRTMVPNAEEKLEAHLASCEFAREEWNTTQKLKVDPRITRVGRVLRKLSIDELPQLWNVLNGTMSLVGPRPMMVEQQSEYPGRAYYRLRPGITGFWQVSARNESTFADRAGFDDAYDKEMSFSTDMKTLLKTVGVVLKGTGY